MNAAPLHTALVPVAATPHTPVVSGGGGAVGGITPASGQGFVPATAGDAAAAGAAPAGAAAAGTAAPAAATDGIDAQTALKALVEALGAEYGDPIIAADGSVYMEKKTPDVRNGKLSLAYVLVGKIDRTTGKMQVNPTVLEQVKAKAAAGAERKLVKVGESYTWQTFTKGEDGKITAQVVPATEAELKEYQAKLQAEQAQQAAQAKVEGRGDWQEKLNAVAQNVGLVGMAGQVASGLAAGPNALTGKPGSNWMSAWFLAQRINGKTEGKLLPTWLTSGPVATGIEWALQGYQFLDLGKDIATVRNFIKKTPLPNVHPGALDVLTKSGTHPEMAKALTQLGTELRDGTLQMVEGTGNAAVLNTKLGAAQLVAESDVHKAIAATDPIRSKGLTVKNAIDSGMGKGLGMLSGLIQPAMIGASALSLISSSMTVKGMVEKNGAKSLIHTQQGRGAALGAISGAGFLGMYLVPMAMQALKVANPAVAAASAAINIGSTILGGVQMLNSYGLFGGEGFLNKDAFRAIFLIPPLTPLGAFGFYMKHKKEEAAKANAKLEAAQKYAVAQVQQQREMVKLQLQNGGSVAGATPAADGSINVTTSIPTDMSLLVRQLNGQVPTAAAPPAAAPAAAAAAPATAAAPAAAAPEGASALEQQREQLNMAARPMR